MATVRVAEILSAVFDDSSEGSDVPHRLRRGAGPDPAGPRPGLTRDGYVGTGKAGDP